MPKIYTKKGDSGKTRLYGGKEVWKDDLRVEAYGNIDELASSLGIVISQIKIEKEKLLKVQEDLLQIASLLANPNISKKSEGLERRTTYLEDWIDDLEKTLSPLKNFILPRGSLISSYLHISRSICRRAERSIVALSKKEKIEPHIIPYINRLSDLLFVLARFINKKEKYKEILWTTNKK